SGVIHVLSHRLLFLGKHRPILKENFDFAIIDCPPNLYATTQNAICISDYLVVPCIADDLSTMGMRLLLREINSTAQRLKKSERVDSTPELLGIVLSRYRDVIEYRDHGKAAISGALNFFKKHQKSIFITSKSRFFEEQPVREYVDHARAVRENRPMCLYGGTSNAKSDISELTEALIDAI
ncbi:ParA family protein, partial [Thermodesulfobacteriota bacterium]